MVGKHWAKHITEQPLHQTLKQYRLIAIASVIFIGYMMLNCWEFFEYNHDKLSTEGTAGFFTLVAALLGAFVKCINNIQVRHEE